MYPWLFIQSIHDYRNSQKWLSLVYVLLNPSFTDPWASSHSANGRLTAISREVSKPRISGLNFSIALTFDRHLAEMPVKYQSDTTITIYNFICFETLWNLAVCRVWHNGYFVTVQFAFYSISILSLLCNPLLSLAAGPVLTSLLHVSLLPGLLALLTCLLVYFVTYPYKYLFISLLYISELYTI